MSYKVVTAVATEPISLADARLHLRVDTISGSHPDDSLITSLITAAREMAEHYTGRALAPQTLELALDGFPCDSGEILLPMPPVATITYVKYTDTAGVEQTISASAYSLSLYGDARRLAPTYGNYWPITQAIPDAVRVKYVTGYTAAPKAAISGMLLILGHLYENRQEASRMKVEQIPMGACALLNTVKIWGY